MTLKAKAKSGIFWSFLNQSTTQVINFAITLLLARLLLPSDYGLIGLIAVFIAIGRSLTDAGFSSSLIRTKDVDDVDYSTVFFVNFISSAVLYTVAYISAPFIANFFEEPALMNLIRVMSLIFIINASTMVQSTKLNKALRFREQFKLQAVALVLSSGVAVYLAMNDFGVWSLVIKDLSYGLIASVQLWLYSKWTPKLKFDYNKLKYHFNFGYKLLLTNLISKVFSNSYNLVIGKVLSTTQVGLFTRAQSMQDLPSGIVFNTINKVLYPLLAEVNDDDGKLKRVYKQIMSLVGILIIPVLVFMGIVAEPLFLFLLTEKWLGAVPYFKILIIAALFSPFQKYNLNICNVKGRSDLVLQISIVEYTLILISLFSILYFGIFGLLWGMVAATLITVIYTSYRAGNLIEYSPWEQFSDIIKPMAAAGFAGLITYLIMNIPALKEWTHFWILVLSFIIFFSLYLLISLRWQRSQFLYLYRLIKK